MIMPSRKALKQTALAKLEKNWNSTLKVNAILASLAIFIELPLRIFSNNELLKQFGKCFFRISISFVFTAIFSFSSIIFFITPPTL